MSSPPTDPCLPAPKSSPPDECPAPPVPAHETYNLLTLALHQIAVRIGWTFKTETIIVPAFLDVVAEAGWLRGCLPLVRNLGQSVPPLFLASALKRLRLKKRALAAFALLIGTPYLVLGWVWLGLGGHIPVWMAGLFLVLYLLFFVFYGLYQVAFGTVQGKLIRPTRRGQLLWGSTVAGLPPTLVLCWLLMPGWLREPVPGYGYLFLAVAMWFVFSGLLVGLLREPASEDPIAPTPLGSSLREALSTVRWDANLRRLIILIMLFGIALVIIPHYQNFAKNALGLKSQDLVLFVLTHTTAVTVYSLLIGPVADRWGNRLTLRVLILGAAIAPAYAVLLPHLVGNLAPGLFWIVFVPLGLTPLVPTILFNYTLELCDHPDHPRYLSLVSLAMMPPYLLSPLVGHLVEILGFPIVAWSTFVLMLACGGLTFWLDEPRNSNKRAAGSRAVDEPGREGVGE